MDKQAKRLETVFRSKDQDQEEMDRRNSISH